LAFACAACGGDDDAGGGAESPTRLLPLHAEPDPIDGGRIVDADGREVLLRGVNVNAFAEYWSSNEFPTTFPLTESDADRMAEIGWNTVRLLLSWSRVEPQPGEYDEEYLAQVEAAVRLLASRGIYSVIDLHQDAWGATLAARPDEMCNPPSQPAFGWDGAPEWATLDGGAARCAIAGIRETSAAVLAAFQAFWEDAEGPGGLGIRTRYARMLAHVAGRFANHPAVAGYDLMNEPNAFSPEQQQLMAEMYSDALGAIRAAEDEAEGFPHLVFFEPSALWSALGAGAPPDFDRDRDVVYAPHIYMGGFNGGPITEEAFQIARDEANRFGGAPVFSGEWGSDPRRAADPDDGYFLTHQRLQDEFRISATLWTWRESCGDPHKAGDYRAGNVPYVWGEFEVDCTTNEVTGMREPLVDQLTRAYVRAAPGRISELTYDPQTGAFHASGSEAPLGAQLVVFYPNAQHPLNAITAEGLRTPTTHPAPGDNVYVVAEVTGAEWSVAITPSP
jgi:endoglycosylceramidase